ncbi:jupiter microtubule associated homolog 1 isoform X2 [Xenopus laevis]|uniref:Jupiter microtubule associated homolog 1 isoform X2 n=1 Tax=Xenopus laevis TaxID=8355 RepID=A0A8J1LXX1_XENLA|nr:jupiter microtubule associated homolog 1 isoform X2 [Xenopus laevis]
MTTTSMFSGLEPNTRSSSRVLMPPGGGSSFSFGVGEAQAQQPTRKHKMASDIFGVLDNEPASTKQAQETGTSDACDDLDSAAQRTCQSEDFSNASGNMSGISKLQQAGRSHFEDTVIKLITQPMNKEDWLFQSYNSLNKDTGIAAKGN